MSYKPTLNTRKVDRVVKVECQRNATTLQKHGHYLSLPQERRWWRLQKRIAELPISLPDRGKSEM